MSDNNNNNNNNSVNNRPEFDFKLFTGVTLFDIATVDTNEQKDEKSLTASEKAKNWFNEYYMSLLTYHQQRQTRLTEFYVELNDITVSPVSREEKKQMELEFYQKESTYLRMKRKTKLEEFEPLFKFTKPVSGMVIAPQTPLPKSKQQSPLSTSYPTTPGDMRSLMIGNAHRSPFNSSDNLGTVRFDKNVRFADTDSIPSSPPQTDEFDRSNVRRTKSISSINKSSTPTPLKNKSFTMMFNLDNKTKLEQTEKLLKEKEEDTRIAAEIGKTLLERNEELDEELKQLRQRNIDQNERLRYNDDEMDRLRTEMVMLQARLESATRDNNDLELALHRASQKDYRRSVELSPHSKQVFSRQMQEIEQLKQTLEEVQESEDRLKKNRDRLVEQNESLSHSVADLQMMLDDKVDMNDYETMGSKVKQLRDKNRALRERIKEMEKENGSMFVEPELMIKSAFQDMIKNEELLMSTPKVANLRVIQDAKILLKDLETEVASNVECSLISSLIKFLERDTTTKLSEQPSLTSSQQELLNESFDSSIADQELSDPKSALYMLVCVVSIYKYTRYDKLRIENDSNTIDELGSQVDALRKHIANLEFDLGEAKMLNSKLEEDIDLLKTPQPSHMSMADELRSAFKLEEDNNAGQVEKVRQEYEDQIVQLNQQNLQYALEMESLRHQLSKQEESLKEIRSQLKSKESELNDLSSLAEKLNISIDAKNKEIFDLIGQLDSNRNNKELAEQEQNRLLLEKQNDIERLNSTLEERLALIKKQEKQISDLDNELVQVNQFILEKEMTIERYLNEIKEKDNQINSNSEQIQQLSNTIKERDNQIVDKDIGIKDRDSQINSNKEQIQQLSSKVNELDGLVVEKNQLIQDKQSLIESISKELESLNSVIQEKQDSIIKLSEQYEEEEKIVKKLQIEIDEKQTTVSKLNQDISERDEKIQILNESVQSKELHSQTLSKEIQEKSELITKITTDNQQKEENINQLTNDNQINSNEIKRLQQEIDSIRKEGANTSDADKTLIQQLRKEKNELLGEHIISINALNSKLTLLKRDKESMESMRNQDNIRIKNLEQTILDLEAEKLVNEEQSKKQQEADKQSLTEFNDFTIQQLSNIESKLITSTLDRFNSIESNFNTIQMEKQENDKLIVELNGKVDDLAQINQEHTETISKIQQENVELRKKSDELFVDLQNQKENNDSLSTENAHLKEQIQDLLKKLESKSRKHGLTVKELSQQLFDMTELVKKTQEQEVIEQLIEVPQSDLKKDYSIIEELPLVKFINQRIEQHEDIQHVFPIDSEKHIRLSIYDGVLMCKLVNMAREGTIDERVMNVKPVNRIEVEQNFNLVCNSARAIGCIIQNITPQSIIQDPTITIALIYQLVRVHINSNINLTNYPNLLVLKSADEDIKHFVAQNSSQLLLRWICYHLDIKKTKETIENIILKPSNCIKLLCKLVKELIPPSNELIEKDDISIYEWIISESTNRFKIFPWLSIDTLKSKNEKLGYLFISSLFLSEKGLGITIEENTTKEVTLLVKEVSNLVDVEGTREERAFCMWINSLNLTPYVNNLQQDLQDGLIILQMFDTICPTGTVNWKDVNRHPSNNYMEMENCNLGIDIAKKLRFSLVGIGGRDIHEGNRKLTLAVIWQACKYHLLSILKGLRSSNSAGAKEINDNDIIRWANQKVTTIGKSTGIHGFKDTSIGNGLFLIDLLESMSKGCINYSIVTPGDTDENKKLNAQYIINVARKLDCCIFLVWEDIVEVKPKMLMTLVAQLYIKSECKVEV